MAGRTAHAAQGRSGPARSDGPAFTLEAAPIRFASWMGGDRDGNPNVTASVTREVLLLARWMAADLYLRDIDKLAADLSMQQATAELLAVAGEAASRTARSLNNCVSACGRPAAGRITP